MASFVSVKLGYRTSRGQSVLLLREKTWSCRTGLGSTEDQCAPECCLTTQLQCQVARIIS